jgi:hypothetical protein
VKRKTEIYKECTTEKKGNKRKQNERKQQYENGNGSIEKNRKFGRKLPESNQKTSLVLPSRVRKRIFLFSACHKNVLVVPQKH